MLTAEEARAALSSIADRDWRVPAAQRIRKLPRKLRRIAAALVAPEAPWGDGTRNAWAKAVHDAGIALDRCSEADIVAVCTAMHPGLGPALAHRFVSGRGQPYQRSWERRAFRAPNHREMTRQVRVDDLRISVDRLGPYDRDAVWLAGWAPHIGSGEGYGHAGFADAHAGPILAAAIDLGGPSGEQVLQTLLAVGNGEHPTGVMGRHVIAGLLRSSRTEGWDFIERLLLAAQRQEGLRQSILESADEGHVLAFIRLLGVVLENDLLRFAATVRAAGVWLGFGMDVTEIPAVRDRLTTLHRFLTDPKSAGAALRSDDTWETYLSLVAAGMIDVAPALRFADVALQSPSPDVRAATIRFLAATGLSAAFDRILALLDDPDLGVAALAHAASDRSGTSSEFERYERLAGRLPEKQRSVDPIGIEREPIELDRSAVVATMFRSLGKRPLSAIMPWFDAMDPWTRGALAREAGKRFRLTPDVRDALLRMVGDRSPQVRAEAVAAMGKLKLAPTEAPVLEAMLTRKAGDLRRAVIDLLARQPAPAALASARRLWDEGDAPQRDAACELLGAIEPRSAAVSEVAAMLRDAGPSPEQQRLLGELGGGTTEGADDPGLGLFDPSRRSPVIPPTPPAGRVRFTDDAALRLAAALDDLAEAHRDTPFLLVGWQGSREVLLADARWLPSPFHRNHDPEADGAGMVLPEIFRPFWDEREAELRGTAADGRGHDGLDALRAHVALAVRPMTKYYGANQGPAEWWFPIVRDLVGREVGELRHAGVVDHVLLWMIAEHADDAVIDECLDGVEAAFGAIPDKQLRALPRPDDRQHYVSDWRTFVTNMTPWLTVAERLFAIRPDLYTDERSARHYRLMRWREQPVAHAAPMPVGAQLVARAHAAGAANDHDLLALLLARHDRTLTAWTRRRRDPVVADRPGVAAVVDRLRDRIVTIERNRGELATPASSFASRLGSVEGADLALELLARLGRAKLVRGYSWGNDGREAVHSHLIQVSHPAPDDTADRIRALADQHRIKERRLVEMAVYAPQWADLVEDALGWDGLTDAIWWYHAHTKDDRWSVEAEVRETWAALSAERTPLIAGDLVAGAVDVDWFHRARSRLGTERWTTLHKAAKLASSGSGHRRAQLFAEAMSGVLTEEAVLTRIRTKRHQDSVRALGLLPLPDDDTRADILQRRYAALREFERGSRKFGSQRRASEATAVRIGIENLARSAGTPDPQRFVWAMEAAEAGDLADGPVTVTEGDLEVTLSVSPEGEPDLSVRRGERKLKSVPAKLRKVEAIAELRDRKTALTRQASRVRRSLEDAMVREDRFEPEDFRALARHPVVAPMLALLVFVDRSGAPVRRTTDGFTDVDGNVVEPDGPLRLAHPVDLVASSWPAWQEQLFAEHQRQPFKQVFRELYVLTEQERSAGPASHRWDGHQVQPRQASALFGQRGWHVDREGGDVSRVFHAHDIVARIVFADGFLTPAEVELPTIDGVYFSRRADWRASPIETVPPIVFSETMRDLDLVVSVAHAGGVDPEATASTVDMRAALVRETARVMKLDNVRMVESHVVIEGGLGEYSVHLGSGSVHRRPGGSVCIIPVDAQRRGRIFLPFADNDPKTAEVVSKVLLLARDTKIQDPTILDQLRS